MTHHPEIETPPPTLVARVQCDDCNAVHHVEFRPAEGYTNRAVSNGVLETLGWHVYDSGYRHRCRPCVGELRAREADTDA